MDLIDWFSEENPGEWCFFLGYFGSNIISASSGTCLLHTFVYMWDLHKKGKPKENITYTRFHRRYTYSSIVFAAYIFNKQKHRYILSTFLMLSSYFLFSCIICLEWLSSFYFQRNCQFRFRITNVLYNQNITFSSSSAIVYLI